MARFSGSMPAYLLAGALVAASAGVAAAADLPLPPPPPVPPPAAAPSFSGWYLRGDVGYGFDEMSSFRSTDAASVPGFRYDGAQLGNQAMFGLGVGYQFNNWFRADITGEYRTDVRYWGAESYAAGVNYGAGKDGYSGFVHSGVFLANGYFDLGTWYGITPFVGGGVGVAINNFHGLTDIGLGPGNLGAYGVAPSKTTSQFAWALMAGVSYAISPNWRLELSYRYLDMGKASSNAIACIAGCTNERQSFDMASNDIRVGLRYMFAEVPAPAPSLPLISKY